MSELSIRLSTIASLVPNGAKVCDVGTDHGYLAIYLKKNGIASSVIATDIREKPLETARRNIAKCSIDGIDLRLCDGLSDVSPEEADTVIIAGMGGEVISSIISSCEWLSLAPEPLLIIQPTTSAEALRKFLCNNGFSIKKEIPVSENGKLYSVMTVRYIGQTLIAPKSYYYIGLVSPESPEGLQYIEKQYRRCRECAEALKNIPAKSSDCLHFKQAADGIKAIINSVTESK